MSWGRGIVIGSWLCLTLARGRMAWWRGVAWSIVDGLLSEEERKKEINSAMDRGRMCDIQKVMMFDG